MLDRKQQQSDARRIVHEASLTAWLEQHGDAGLGARMRAIHRSWLTNFTGSGRLSLGLGSEFDEAELPFPPASLDLVMLNFALDFTPRPDQVLQEVGRVLVPGGRLLIAGVNRFSPEYAATRIMPSLAWLRALTPLSCHKLERLLTETDLCPDYTRTLSSRSHVGEHALSTKLSNWLEEHRLGALYLINARKEHLEPVSLAPVLRLNRLPRADAPLAGAALCSGIRTHTYG